MTSLRILHSEAATGFGGQEHRIYKEMMAMRERGHHMEAVCQPHALLAQRLRDAGFQVHTLPMDGTVNYLQGVLRIRSILKAGRFDVLNTHSRRDTVLAAMAGRLAGTPLIVRTRHLANKPGSLLSYTVLPHRVTTVSDYVRNVLLKRGVNPDHVATVYSPIELPEKLASSSLRQELALGPDDIVVICVAVMRAQKGHKALIDAIEPIIRQRPDVHLVLVGSGSPTFEEVQALVQARQLGSRIHLLGTRRDVPNLLASADLFALATEHEASGTVFVEAAAAGLPVIATDVGGVSEMLQDDVSGILVPLGNQAALTQALQRLIEDAPLRAQMGQAGLQAVRLEGKFSLESLARTTESCYVRWLAERQS
ncbi:glycosyltransferase family 4 protein [Alcaligenaceae bacterium]|nr:glycosyltransferase family 4 protein [Alcaligenaceae bacterium]